MTKRIALSGLALAAVLGACALTLGHQSPAAPTVVQAGSSLASQFGIPGLTDELLAEQGVTLQPASSASGVSEVVAEQSAAAFVPRGRAVAAVFANVTSRFFSTDPGDSKAVDRPHACWVVIVKTSAPQVPYGPHGGSQSTPTANNMAIVLVDGRTGKAISGWRAANMPVLN